MIDVDVGGELEGRGFTAINVRVLICREDTLYGCWSRDRYVPDKSYLCVGDLQDSPRVVFVVSNAAIALPPVHEFWVQTRVGHG